MLTSAVNGPVATCLFKLQMNGAAINAGMGTCGLCGPIGFITGWLEPAVEENVRLGVDLAAAAESPLRNYLGLAVVCFVIPAVGGWFFSSLMRKKGLIKDGDLDLHL